MHADKKQKKFKTKIKYDQSESAGKKAARYSGKTLKIILKSIMTLLLVCVITGTIVASVICVVVMQNVNTEDSLDLENIQYHLTSIIYGTNNKGETVEVKRLYANGENRIWVDLEQVPEHTRRAFICTEDKRFKEHPGVDFKRTIGAFANLFLNFYNTKQGASTITQQLIKNVTGDDDVSVSRKVEEIFRALNLERKYSKDDILEAYMNTVHFANGCNGIQAAANLYFDKDVSQLTLAESAAIVGITQSPVYYDPFIHPENNRERQEYILKNMLDLGAVTQPEYEQALAEELVFAKDKFQQTVQEIQSYYVDQVITDVIKSLVEEKGFSEETAAQKLFSGGYRIYTPLNVDVQEAVESVYENPYDKSTNYPKVSGEVQPESAVAVMDLRGNVVAMVGGVGEKKINRGLNRAAQMKRSIGSTMKPLGAYGPAIEYNVIDYSTIVEDSPYNEYKENWPVNYYKGYYGNMTVQEALQRSTNTVATKVCGMVTPQKSFDFVTGRLGLPLVSSAKVEGKVMSDMDIAPLSLGSLTYGVSPVQLAAAYEPFGNGGSYYTPRTFTKILDTAGNVVLDKPPIESKAFSAESATVLNKMLQNVVTGPHGTGTYVKFGGWEIAAKTGTTSDNKDYWFVGMTPHYVAAVWCGYDIQKEMNFSSMATQRLWKSCMTKIHQGLSEKQFPVSSEVQQHNYCTKSGLLASENCATTALGWYKPDNIPPLCDQCG